MSNHFGLSCFNGFGGRFWCFNIFGFIIVRNLTLLDFIWGMRVFSTENPFENFKSFPRLQISFVDKEWHLSGINVFLTGFSSCLISSFLSPGSWLLNLLMGSSAGSGLFRSLSQVWLGQEVTLAKSSKGASHWVMPDASRV